MIGHSLAPEVGRNNREMMQFCIPFMPGGEVFDHDGLVRIKTDLDSAIFNGICYTALNRDGARSAASAQRAYFEGLGGPWAWWVNPGQTPIDLDQVLVDSGFKLRADSPGMAMDISGAEFDVQSDLRIEPLFAASHADDLRVPLAAFGLGQDVDDAYVDFVRRTAAPGGAIRHVVGYKDDMPVSCGLAFFGSNSAGIYSIATVREMRGRGFGTATTAALLREAKDRGYRSAVLVSTQLGFSVYMALGFREVARMRIYEPSAGATP